MTTHAGVRVAKAAGLAALLLALDAPAWAGEPPLVIELAPPGREPSPPTRTIGPRPGYAGEGETSGSKRTVADTPVVLFTWFNVGEGCGPAKLAIEIAEPPLHGDVTVEATPLGDAFGSDGRRFRPSDERNNCDLSGRSALRVVYRPHSGFEGRDTLVAVVRDDAYTERVSYAILVQR
jgi:hypothetical protein